MPENRHLSVDLAALALLAATAFLGVSLATYSPSDPVPELPAPLATYYKADPVVYPIADKVRNLCGRAGAFSADLLLRTLGLGAYYAVLSLAVFDVLLLARRPIQMPLLRFIGWLASLVGLTTMCAMVAPMLIQGPAIGPGGYLGALGRGWLEMHFAFAGALIVTLSLLAGSLVLCADLSVASAAALVGAALGLAGARSEADAETEAEDAARTPKELRIKNRKRATQTIGEGEDATQIVDPDTNAMPIRIRGKKSEPVAEAEEELDDEAAEEADPSAAAEADADENMADSDLDDEELAEELATAAAANAMAGAASPENQLRVRKPSTKAERQAMIAEIEQASKKEEVIEYQLPPIDLLLQADEFSFDEQEKEVRQKARILEKTFQNFGFNVKVVEIETGPVIAQYEVELEAGLRLSKITCLADDLAIALRVPSVRIVAPIPGKNTVGIEVPNSQRQVVRLREVMEETNGRIKKMEIPIFLGKDVAGKPLTVDLAKLPHLLIAGRTGTGKSVCLNAIIASMLMTRRPDEVRMLMIDPKMVELSGYRNLPHLMHPVVTDMRKAEAILAWAVEKMEERYALLARAGVRHISGYNQLGEEELFERLTPENEEEKDAIPRHLPYIVIVADEIADMMMTSGKEVEQHIIRLAQKSRAVGIHLILATQKPTVDVVTGLIKSNLPARIAFQVASRTDSRVVLDEMGADKLLGNGDMLFLFPNTSQLIRGQGTYLSDDEINQVVEFASNAGEQDFAPELVALKPKSADGTGDAAALKNRDELYEAAIDVVVREGRGSVSLLQRALGIGYGRAARLIDFMAEDGLVGQYAGSQAREVTITLEQWEAMQAGGAMPAGLGGGPVVAPASGPAPIVPKPAKALPKPVAKPKEPAAEEDADDETRYVPAIEAIAQPSKRRSNKIVPLPEPEDEAEEMLDSSEEESDDFAFGVKEKQLNRAEAIDDSAEDEQAENEYDEEEVAEEEEIAADSDDELQGEADAADADAEDEDAGGFDEEADDRDDGPRPIRIKFDDDEPASSAGDAEETPFDDANVRPIPREPIRERRRLRAEASPRVDSPHDSPEPHDDEPADLVQRRRIRAAKRKLREGAT